MAVNELVVGNLNCVFWGAVNKFDLLDFWHEFASQAFESGVKNGRKTKLIMYECKNTLLKGNEPCIIGRFVKDTDLEIKQIMRNGKLVPRDETHESAPSSIFVYLLKSHTILYVGEHKGYPDVRAFRGFIERVLNIKRKLFLETINFEKNEIEIQENIERYPPAHVSFVPFPSGKTLSEELASVEKISNITIKQYLQNGIFNPNSFAKSNQNLMEQVGTGRISYSITSPKNLEGAKEAVNELANQSESELSISATTKHGKKIITNDGLQYRKKLGSAVNNKNMEKATEQIYEIYEEELAVSELPTPIVRNDAEKLGKVDYE